MNQVIIWSDQLSVDEKSNVFGETCANFIDWHLAMVDMKRFGMVIGLKDDSEVAYRTLHAGVGVRDLLSAANISNFNIFVHRLPDGKLYEFGYYEYIGTDYEGDMMRLASDPRNVEWLSLCDPMQVPLPGSTGWTIMEQVFFNE